MFLFIDEQGNISGTASEKVAPPLGFLVVETDYEDINNLFYTEGSIFQKPPQPSVNHIWVKTENKWDLPEFEEPRLECWIAFLLAIISTSVYDKIKLFLSKENPAEYTVLVALLNNSAIPEQVRSLLLEKSLRKVKEAMKESSTPLSSKDIGTINQLIKEKLGANWDISG
jgi:hypothetical protein